MKYLKKSETDDHKSIIRSLGEISLGMSLGRLERDCQTTDLTFHGSFRKYQAFVLHKQDTQLSLFEADESPVGV